MVRDYIVFSHRRRGGAKTKTSKSYEYAQTGIRRNNMNVEEKYNEARSNEKLAEIALGGAWIN